MEPYRGIRTIGTYAAAGLMVVLLACGQVGAQELPLSLSGNASAGYSNSRGRVETTGGARSDSRSTDLPWGFGFLLRSYLLDPRFLSISVDANLLKGSGAQEEFETNYSNVGWNIGLEFLKNSEYPLRFHYLDSNYDQLQRRAGAMNMARRQLGFDWTLRKPKKPPVYVNYQDADYDYGYLPENSTSTTNAFVSKSRTLGVGSRGEWHGWNGDAQYNRIDNRENLAGTSSNLDMLRADLRKQLNSKTTLLANTFVQDYRVDNASWGFSQRLPLTYVRTELETRHTRKLITRLYDQFYRSGFQQSFRQTPVKDSTTPATPPGAQGTSSVNMTGGNADYRLAEFLTVGGFADVTNLSPWQVVTETPTRLVNASGIASWQKRFKMVDTLASVQRGTSYGHSNLGNDRQVPTASYSAGLRVGDRSYLLAGIDGMYTERPDIFEIGSMYRQRRVSAVIESVRLRPFNIQANAGWNDMEFLNARGHEKTRSTTLGVSATNAYLTIQGSRVASTGLRSGLLPLLYPETQLFRQVPLDIINRMPLLPLRTENTVAGLGVRPRQRLELQLRYFRQRLRSTLLDQNLFSEQYEAFLTYGVGKFHLTGGVMQYFDETADLAIRHRTYYFFRLTRAFKIL